jgi:hypothetical protein
MNAAEHHGTVETFPPYIGGDDDEIDEWRAQCQCGYRGRKWTHSVGALSDLVDHLNGVVRGTPTGSARLPEPDLLAAFGRAQYEADAEEVVARAEAAERERDEWKRRATERRLAHRAVVVKVGLLEEALRAATPPDPASVPQWGSPDWREWARTTRAALAGVAMTVVDLSRLMPRTPPGDTVTVEDARELAYDLVLLGCCFVEPTGEGQPSHRRIPPERVSPA